MKQKGMLQCTKKPSSRIIQKEKKDHNETAKGGRIFEERGRRMLDCWIKSLRMIERKMGEPFLQVKKKKKKEEDYLEEKEKKKGGRKIR